MCDDFILEGFIPRRDNDNLLFTTGGKNLESCFRVRGVYIIITRVHVIMIPNRKLN